MCIIDLKFFYRQTKTITISCAEYSRLLHNDVQMMKYKEKINAKSNEIKTLRTQLAYFKARALKRTAENPQDDEIDVLPNVI